jgi:hypothetical protein
MRFIITCSYISNITNIISILILTHFAKCHSILWMMYGIPRKMWSLNLRVLISILRTFFKSSLYPFFSNL